jgi:hypothetical protein
VFDCRIVAKDATQKTVHSTQQWVLTGNHFAPDRAGSVCTDISAGMEGYNHMEDDSVLLIADMQSISNVVA